VTELVPELEPVEPVLVLVAPVLEPVALFVLVPVLEPVLEAVPVFELVVWAVVVWLASAGSWPVTSISVISSQVATNRATAPAITRLRMVRTRALRACLIAIASAGLMGQRMRPLRSKHVRTC
jgi:hypothetical protein